MSQRTQTCEECGMERRPVLDSDTCIDGNDHTWQEDTR